MCGMIDLQGFVKVAVLYVLYLLFKMNISKWGEGGHIIVGCRTNFDLLEKILLK